MREMLDYDLAKFYKIETIDLNKSVKRNNKRFPDNYCFELNNEEFKNRRCQFVTSSLGFRRYLHYVFTEQGVLMLS
ncbi:MAG: ORF6N domain-containing protein [Candidatus Woesearchaeota archaeon]